MFLQFLLIVIFHKTFAKMYFKFIKILHKFLQIYIYIYLTLPSNLIQNRMIFFCSLQVYEVFFSVRYLKSFYIFKENYFVIYH